MSASHLDLSNGVETFVAHARLHFLVDLVVLGGVVHLQISRRHSPEQEDFHRILRRHRRGLPPIPPGYF